MTRRIWKKKVLEKVVENDDEAGEISSEEEEYHHHEQHHQVQKQQQQQQDDDDDFFSDSHRTRFTSTTKQTDDDDDDDCNNMDGDRRAADDDNTYVTFGGLYRISKCNTVCLTRLAVIVVWIVAAIVVAYYAHSYTIQHQMSSFEDEYYSYGTTILKNLDTTLDRKLVSFDTLATTICTIAHISNQTFPFVVIPNFAALSGTTRVSGQVMSIAWLPLVIEENRHEWQDYAMLHRMEVANTGHDQENIFRMEQDILLGYTTVEEGGGRRRRTTRSSRPEEDEYGQQQQQIQEEEEDPQRRRNLDDDEDDSSSTTTSTTTKTVQVGDDTFEVIDNVVQDGTDFHYDMYNFLTGVRPPNSGPYFPNWQRSPVNAARQSTLNADYGSFPSFKPTMKHLLSKQQQQQDRKSMMLSISSSYWGATLSNAITVKPHILNLERENLLLSQYRHNVDSYLVEPKTSLTYPVLDYEDWDKPTLDSRNLVGLLTMPIYWRLYFENILPETAQGVLVIVENSFNETFSYRVDGREAMFLGFGDPRLNATIIESSPILQDYPITQILQSSGNAETLSYTTLQLDTEFSTYKICVYPTEDTANVYIDNNDAVVYTSIVVSVFVMALLVFCAFDYFVRQRQNLLMSRSVRHARKAATAERELNEFVAHEVRNPLSAAISACSFVSLALNDQSSGGGGDDDNNIVANTSQRSTVMEDVSIINSSLKFINDLLRNMLDLHRAQDHELTVKKLPVDIYRDVLEPVATMLYGRDNGYEIYLECTRNLLVLSDGLRLKQIMMNLGRNASKFVIKGYIRLRADVIDDDGGRQKVRLYVEDSGPGIGEAKRATLFDKYQESLDRLSQGTGIGLCLCKQLATIMGGDIWLDDKFDSGVEGYPGTRFVVDLNCSPLDHDHCLRLQDRRSLLFHPHMGNSTKMLKDEQQKEPVEPSSVLEGDPPPPEAPPSSPPATPSVTLPSIPKEESLPEDLSVLFVDDDTILRKLFGRTIKRLMPHWTVDEASSGETAIQKVMNENLADGENMKNYDLIFMDQYMPCTEKPMLGTEATRELRVKGFSNIIVGLSANDCGKVFMNAGANAFWCKPIPTNKDRLKQELMKLLQTKCSREDVQDTT